MRVLSKLRGVLGLGFAQLTQERQQLAFAVFGVTLAVLSVTLLTGVGYGVIVTGEEKFDSSGRDIWVSGGPIQLQPGSIGGMEAMIHDAHDVSEDIGADEDVQTAVPMLFQTVYAGAGDDVETTLAVGVPSVGSGGGAVSLIEGSGFSQRGDVHYADGTYDGPRVREVILDPRLAAQQNVSVNETFNVGGTVIEARTTEYEIVGTSRTFTRFLGTPTLTLPLSELQTMTGTAQTDAATMITVDVASSANISAVETRLQAQYPNYDVRTNQEQLQAVLAKQALVIASGGALVVLGIIAGLALTVNILSLLVYHQRKPIAAIRAMGVSKTTLVGMVGTQGIVVGVLGGGLGLALTPPLVRALDWVAYTLVGFEGLVRMPEFVFVAGAIIAVVIGTLSAVIAGWRVVQLESLAALRD